MLVPSDDIYILVGAQVRFQVFRLIQEQQRGKYLIVVEMPAYIIFAMELLKLLTFILLYRSKIPF